ncbi:5340_t:CDS:2, partial [Acaulospora morrowiae]
MVEEEITKVESDNKIRKGQDKQTETILVEELDISIMTKELARKLPEDQQGDPMEIVQGLRFMEVMLCINNTNNVSVQWK